MKQKIKIMLGFSHIFDWRFLCSNKQEIDLIKRISKAFKNKTGPFLKLKDKRRRIFLICNWHPIPFILVSQMPEKL